MTTRNIERLFNVIDKSLFTITGKLDYDRLTDALIVLANEINKTDTDESIWYLGECGNCTLGDLIPGAYWHFTEWHGGQWSKGYAALSALGQIFDPGMSCGEDDNEAYQALETMATDS